MVLEFATAARIVFGAGSVAQIGEIAAGFGKRAFLISSRSGGVPEIVFDRLERNRIGWEKVVVSGEPTVTSIQSGVEIARLSGCDVVIGIGGGSVLDSGKAIAAMLTNDGELLDYLEVVGRNQPLVHAAMPFIAVPTTAGTGSEVTRNAVLSVPEQRVKVSLRSSLLLPRVALVDPELTYKLPPVVTASTGMDALAQVIEPYVSTRANWMTDLFCRQGIQRAAGALVRAYRNGDDPEARVDMCWASLLGGLALANSGLGAVHGFAAVIGGMFKAPHGQICARLLAPVVGMNVRALRQRAPENIALQRYAEISGLLTGDADAGIEAGISWLVEVCETLRIPSLTMYGVRSEDVPLVVDKAAAASSMKANPLVLTRDELTEILMQAL